MKGLELLPQDEMEEFQRLASGYSVWVPTPNETGDLNVFFCSPGVGLLSKPDFCNLPLQPFLKQFDDFRKDGDPPFLPYVEDKSAGTAVDLVKTAGQLCYLAFGPKRTMNADAGKYLEHIRAQKHGSVLEHANFSFLLWGISRSLTHELVRHRAGFAFSQVSQRYVDGARLRFVRRPEFHPPILEQAFCNRIDEAALAYDDMAVMLTDTMADTLAGLPSATDKRKAVNQAARAVLPNETEAPIIVTANARAWRHMLNMRGSLFAEPEIRKLSIRVLISLHYAAPEMFEDFEIRREETTGRLYLFTPHEKV